MSALRAAAGGLAALALRALGASWRLRAAGPPPPSAPHLLVAWHRGLLVAAYALRGRGLWVPLSLSRDGELAEAALRRLGFARSPRGSSSRGGSALLREMIRRVRAGESGGVLPDGPRGPAFAVKPGVLALASITGAPIVPVGVAAAPARRLASWDRALVPLPFARVRLCYGNALEIPKSANAAALEHWRSRLAEELHRLDREAEARLAQS
jgi:lysophospholipid acyltransferase (LPLAT)-like uncharacterized protein